MHHSIVLGSLIALTTATGVWSQVSEDVLVRAGDNRGELEAALGRVEGGEREDLAWLIEHMPEQDLRTLDADFLVENVQLARAAWMESPWHEQVDLELYRDAILPYASVNEQRERWRPELRERLIELVEPEDTITTAATRINRELFPLLGVKYSTGRKKPDQSPSESMESGLASCTGLSILLIDACRSVGIPARFTGTALWSDRSGNHSWVEVWDDGWHFTGAAEPTGDQLDQGWFTGRASKASRENPRTAIYSVTWRRTPLHFPMVWRPQDQSVHAVDVTDRYTTTVEPLPEGSVRARFRILDEANTRVARAFTVTTEDGTTHTLRSRDEGFDANDHVELIVPLGGSITWGVPGHRMTIEITHDEQLLTLAAPDANAAPDPEASTRAIESLQRWLATPERAPLPDQAFANVPLTRADDQRARALLWNAHRDQITRDREAELASRTIAHGNHTMPFWYTTYGEKPEDGRSLWISMHGGGGAPPRVNTQQWENQKRLYTPEEGVYLAPRAPTDTWNLWHQGHIDPMFDRLIETLVVLEDVNPDKVYLMGYSAGGDGVYQLAPRMADRWAATAMMAGHPNDARPESLRNTAFTLHMGANDTPYQRNQVAKTWQTRLAELREADPDGYDHWVEIHEGKGHWMERADAAALPWMAERTRTLRPTFVHWRQDDVHHDRFYWLAVEEPRTGSTTTARLRTPHSAPTIELGGDVHPVRIRLDDELADLDRPIRVVRGDEVLFEGRVHRTIATLADTLDERGDPRGIFSGEITLD
ncbi:MAG: hypothetical protein CBC35_02675 [Planctomycetes bacterium TMED75]|nr:polyhydroxyalkanoate depolymerase [Planctomycetaceae bacterium]OUU95480.1 MAG: hypothetical protein CBC35_02675 [Planctomycetes bacterium TMED75]